MYRNLKFLRSKSDLTKGMVSLPTITLAAEEADRFIDYIVDQSVLKNNARIVKMQKETKNIRAIGFGTSKFLKPAATFSASDYKKTFTENKIALTSKKVRGCVVIYDDDLEDNIEGDAFADHLMKMVTAQIANELEEAFWIGDTHSLGGFAATDIRSLWDGWRYRMRYSQVAADTYYNTVTGRTSLISGKQETLWAVSTGYSVGDVRRPITATGFNYICTVAGTTAGAEPATWPTILGDSIVSGTSTWRCHSVVTVLFGKIAEQNASAPYNWEFKFGKMLAALPSQYKAQGLAKLRFFTNDQVVQNYVDALAARSTILGDQAILGKGPLQYGTVPIIPVPMMSTTMSAAGVHGAGAYTDCFLTPAENLIVGIQRDIKLESQREAADEATYFFYSMRSDIAIEDVAGCVLLEKLTK